MPENRKMKKLIEGSKYVVTSMGTKDRPIVTHGTYEGIVVVGGADAVVIKMGREHRDLKGRLRLIPTHVILSIDIISEPKKKVEKKTDVEDLYV